MISANKKSQYLNMPMELHLFSQLNPAKSVFHGFKNPQFFKLFKSVKYTMDRDWWYFGSGLSYWKQRCQQCMDRISGNQSTAVICAEMINCWKIELWQGNLRNLEQVMMYLLERSLRDKHFYAKMSLSYAVWHEPKGKRQGSGNTHSLPESSKPNAYLSGTQTHDRVIVIHAKTIAERDKLRESIFMDLWTRGLYNKNSFPPYRRGSVIPHETIFGPWEQWYDMNMDYDS